MLVYQFFFEPRILMQRI